MKSPRRLIVAVLVVIVGCSSGSTVTTPSKDPKMASENELAIIADGISAYDRGEYDKAIADYQQVLATNPDNVQAMYECGMTYFAKDEHAKALELAKRAAQYTTPMLGDVYNLMGNELDILGKPKDAIVAYKYSLEQSPGNYLTHFNLALVYAELGDASHAKMEFKQAITIRPSHPSSHFWLGKTFDAEGNEIPALLAFTRFLVLEPQSERASVALGRVKGMLLEHMEKKTGSETSFIINLDLLAPKDEGDFSMISLMLGLKSATQAMDSLKDTPSSAKLERSYALLFDMIGTETKKKEEKGFVWSCYAPYFAELKRNNFTRALVSHILQDGSMPADSVKAFLDWSKGYRWPADM